MIFDKLFKRKLVEPDTPSPLYVELMAGFDRMNKKLDDDRIAFDQEMEAFYTKHPQHRPKD